LPLECENVFSGDRKTGVRTLSARERKPKKGEKRKKNSFLETTKSRAKETKALGGDPGKPFVEGKKGKNQR